MKTQSGRNVVAPKRFEDEQENFTPGSGFVGSDHYDHQYGGGNIITPVQLEEGFTDSYDYTDGFVVPDEEEEYCYNDDTSDEEEFEDICSDDDMSDNDDDMSDDEED